MVSSLTRAVRRELTRSVQNRRQGMAALPGVGSALPLVSVLAFYSRSLASIGGLFSFHQAAVLDPLLTACPYGRHGCSGGEVQILHGCLHKTPVIRWPPALSTARSQAACACSGVRAISGLSWDSRSGLPQGIGRQTPEDPS